MNPWGMLRLGKLFEDLDALAGNVAFLHAESEQPHTRSQVLVTASIDGIKVIIVSSPLMRALLRRCFVANPLQGRQQQQHQLRQPRPPRASIKSIILLVWLTHLRAGCGGGCSCAAQSPSMRIYTSAPAWSTWAPLRWTSLSRRSPTARCAAPTMLCLHQVSSWLTSCIALIAYLLAADDICTHNVRGP
eukprot:scaffold1419_cov410-Prasinococcus_capsulatus_cf.AAC.17